MDHRRTLRTATVTAAVGAAGLVGVTASGTLRRSQPARRWSEPRAGEHRGLPLCRLTFLMTDVAGSTRMWEERPELAGAVLERHEELIHRLVHACGGVLVRSKGEGDSTFSAFANPCGAARAGVEIQRALQLETWPDGAVVRIRAATYTGEAERRESTYYGPAPNRCARLRAAAHPGQTLCSQSTAAQLLDLPSEIVRTDLGVYRLRDVVRPERIFQLGHRELRTDFPPLRTPAMRLAPAARTDEDHGREALAGQADGTHSRVLVPRR